MWLCNIFSGRGREEGKKEEEEEEREEEGREAREEWRISNMELTGRVFSSSLFICLHFLSLERLAHPDPHRCGSTI